MWQFNVQSAVAASYVASKLLIEGGLLILTGANAAINPTPTMISYLFFVFLFKLYIIYLFVLFDKERYGITKAATHHLIKSLAADNSGLPKKVPTLLFYLLVYSYPPLPIG